MSERPTRTVRLQPGQPEDLAVIAAAEGISTNEAIVRAIDDYIARKRTDTTFRDRIARFIDEDRDLLDRLAD